MIRARHGTTGFDPDYFDHIGQLRSDAAKMNAIRSAQRTLS